MTPTLRSTFAAVALGACLLVGATACGSGDGGGTASAHGQDAPGEVSIEVVDARIEKPLNPSVAAVRMVVRNSTSQADTLETVSSPIAERATIHRSGTDAEGRATMTPAGSLEIPPRSSVTFQPGGLHVMLTGITGGLELGDEVDLTLTFAGAGVVEVTAKVVELGAEGDDAEGTHDDH